MTWPILVQMYLFIDKYVLNKGMLLEKSQAGDVRLFESKYESFFEPTIRVLKDTKPIVVDNFSDKGYVPQESKLQWIRVFKILKNTLSKSNTHSKFQKSVKFVVKDPVQSHNFNNDQ